MQPFEFKWLFKSPHVLSGSVRLSSTSMCFLQIKKSPYYQLKLEQWQVHSETAVLWIMLIMRTLPTNTFTQVMRTWLRLWLVKLLPENLDLKFDGLTTAYMSYFCILITNDPFQRSEKSKLAQSIQHQYLQISLCSNKHLYSQKINDPKKIKPWHEKADFPVSNKVLPF